MGDHVGIPGVVFLLQNYASNRPFSFPLLPIYSITSLCPHAALLLTRHLPFLALYVIRMKYKSYFCLLSYVCHFVKPPNRNRAQSGQLHQSSRDVAHTRLTTPQEVFVPKIANLSNNPTSTKQHTTNLQRARSERTHRSFSAQTFAICGSPLAQYTSTNLPCWFVVVSFVSTESTAEKHSHDDNDDDDDDDDDRGCHSQFNNQPNTNFQHNQLGSPK